jgi:hypothetical protein
MLIDVRLNDDVVSGKSAILTVGASSRALQNEASKCGCES